MIATSDAYKELVQSNVRPKCEPIITVSGTTSDGEDIEIVWRAQNIVDLKYVRAIDVLGRELPYMELTWTEIYVGDFNSQNYPEKYNNIGKYMPVTLSFVQDLSFHSSWKQIKNDVLRETIIFPKLFLDAKPVVKGKKITWTAKDFLSFCDKPVKTAEALLRFDEDFFSAFDVYSEKFNGNYSNANTMEMAYTSSLTFENAKGVQKQNKEILERTVFVDSIAKDFFLNYCKLKNYFIYFKEDGSFSFRKAEANIVHWDGETIIERDVMYSLPELEKENSVSYYNFVANRPYQDDSGKYSVDEFYETDDGRVFVFDGFGTVAPSDSAGWKIQNLPNGLAAINSDKTLTSIMVTPYKINEEKNSIKIQKNGIPYDENNKLNPFYLLLDEYVGYTMLKKSQFLKMYFSEEKYSINAEMLPCLMLEPSDVVSLDTGLNDGNGRRIYNFSIITKIEINYNGAIRQKISAHGIDSSY
jgi:hypothetical protein